MATTQAMVKASEPPLTEAQYYRRQLSGLCHGRGIELGALHAPTHGLPAESLVLYVDKESTKDLAARFASDENVAAESLVPVDVVSDGGRLPFGTGALDFLIANHVIEHLPNPLGALSEWYRCLKDGGRLYLSVPDKRFCFDVDRALTSWAHLLADLQRNDDGFSVASREHLREWARIVEGASPDEVDERVDNHLSTVLDYHCHTWTYESMLSTLDHCGAELGLRFEREEDLSSYETWGEMILVLRKDPHAANLLPARYRYPEWHFARMDKVLDELSKGAVWEQSFICAHDGLTAIHVRFGTYMRANSGTLVFRLYRSRDSAPLVRLEADLSGLHDNLFQAFRFATVKRSAGRRFRFTLEAPESAPGNAVTAWCAAHDDASVILTVNGFHIPCTTLNFKAFSVASLHDSDAWSGQRVPPPGNQTDCLRRISRALQSLVSKGGRTN